MAEKVRMTRTTRDVLGVLLDGIDEDLHGLEICRRTGLGSGTTYPILGRLERVGWLTARWEEEAAWMNPADGKRRPRRRFYTLTGEGQRVAREARAAQTALPRLSPGASGQVARLIGPLATRATISRARPSRGMV